MPEEPSLNTIVEAAMRNSALADHDPTGMTNRQVARDLQSRDASISGYDAREVSFAVGHYRSGQAGIYDPETG